MSDKVRSLAARLENYTLTHPQEVLLIQAQIEGEPDTIVIFKGFSSSLARATAFDPEVPVLPSSAVITEIERLQGPYQPQSPQYIERNISLSDFLQRLSADGL